MENTEIKRERAVLAGLSAASMDESERSTEISMEELAAHVEHFLSLDGEKILCLGGDQSQEKILCLGGDLDGCEELAAGMQGVQDMPRLWQALAARGYPQTLLEDLFWNNLRRLI